MPTACSCRNRRAAVRLPKADGNSPWSAFGGIDALRSIGRAPEVRRIAFGSIDFQLDLGIEGDDDALLFFRSQLVLASRLANLPPPLDGVCTALDDAQALAAHVQRARRLGLGGQLCIHPSQVALVNEAFQPTEKQLDWARRVIAAAAQAAGSAVAVDGKMVDRPVLARAQALLQHAPSASSDP